MKQILAYKSYYLDFMSSLSESERLKIRKALLLLESDNKVPYHYIKYLRDGIYELRVRHAGNEFRIFYFYDGDVIIILLNGFKKKSQRTPDRELEKAIRLRNEYYDRQR